MKKAVWAVLFHCTNFTDREYRHRMCPRNEDSWCKYHIDKQKNTDTYKEHLSLPVNICELIKPIFKALSADDLLSKCLHGKTQNANEALNAIIWKRCPKTVFVSKNTLETGVNSAIIEFNEGPSGIILVLREFGLLGFTTSTKSVIQTIKYEKRSATTCSNVVKKRRKVLRSIKKGYSDQEKEKKKPSYVAGGF